VIQGHLVKMQGSLIFVQIKSKDSNQLALQIVYIVQESPNRWRRTLSISDQVAN